MKETGLSSDGNANIENAPAVDAHGQCKLTLQQCSFFFGASQRFCNHNVAFI